MAGPTRKQKHTLRQKSQDAKRKGVIVDKRQTPIIYKVARKQFLEILARAAKPIKKPKSDSK